MNGLFLNGNIRKMQEGKRHRGVDLVFTIMCSFIDRVTEYEKSAKLSIVHVM